MKHLFLKPKRLLSQLLYITFTAGTLLLAAGCAKESATQTQSVNTVSPIASGFHNPLGLEVDAAGLVWVAEQGTGKNDGKVSVVTPQGQKYDVIINFESVPSPGGEPDGPSHLLFADGLLYVLGTGGKMYKVPQSSLKPGVSTIDASSLAVEDIGAFVLAYNFVHNAHDTHPYNFTVGPNGDIYIVDAAANALLRREKNGTLSVVAEVPGIPNPTPVGPNPIESVPTGIYYDGQGFFVTTLLGFPFPAGKAVIYKITPAASVGASVDVYQQGFTSLVDIAKGTSQGKLVLEHGVFGPMGFTPNTGRLLMANGTSFTVLADGLNQPTGLKQVDEHTSYVANYGDNTVVKITY